MSRAMGNYKFNMFANTLRGNNSIHNVGIRKRKRVPHGGVSGLIRRTGNYNTGKLTCLYVGRSNACGSSFTGFVARSRLGTLITGVGNGPNSLLLFTTSGGGVM